MENKDKILEFIGSVEIDSCFSPNILILENSNCLEDAVLNFYKFCIDNKIPCNILLSIQKLPIEYIFERLSWCDIIIYQTTGTTEIFHKLLHSIKSFKDRKIKIIECFNREPVIGFVPDNCEHISMLCIKSQRDDIKRWEVKEITNIKSWYCND